MLTQRNWTQSARSELRGGLQKGPGTLHNVKTASVNVSSWWGGGRLGFWNSAVQWWLQDHHWKLQCYRAADMGWRCQGCDSSVVPPTAQEVVCGGANHWLVCQQDVSFNTHTHINGFYSTQNPPLYNTGTANPSNCLKNSYDLWMVC